MGGEAFANARVGYDAAMTPSRPLPRLVLLPLLAAGACMPAVSPGEDGVFRARVTIDHAVFGACAFRALNAKYPGSVSLPAGAGSGLVRIVRATPFAITVMDVRRAGSGAEVEVRPGSASGALWKDLSLCLPPI